MNNPVIIALDVATVREAREIVEALGEDAGFYKVGLELYTAGGSPFVQELVREGKEVFLDLKFYDIGETVKRATAQVAQLGVRFLTVHGSQAVMRAAVAGRDGSGLQLLGVTVLTSFDQEDLRQLGYPCTPTDLVQLRARNAREAGIDGLVCSPLEVQVVRGNVGPGMVLITPGVRSADTAQGDQKRVATPAAAIAAGADYLVIGRQVTRASDPRAELRRVIKEING